MQDLIQSATKMVEKNHVNDIEFDALSARVRTYTETVFGVESWQANQVGRLATFEGHHALTLTSDVLIRRLVSMTTALAGMMAAKNEAANAQMEQSRNINQSREFDTKSVFIVHGHNHQVLTQVEGFVRSCGLSPIVLKDQPNSGQTLIEKFLKNASVGFAIILLTPDDIGRANSESEEQRRSRQNVILELGYFIGSIGRERLAVLYVEGVELPSDVIGLAYTAYDSSGVWRQALSLELKAAGYNLEQT